MRPGQRWGLPALLALDAAHRRQRRDHRWGALQGRQGGALGNMSVLVCRGGTQPVLRAPAAVPPADEDGGGGGLHQLSTRKRFFPHGAPARAKTLGTE